MWTLAGVAFAAPTVGVAVAPRVLVRRDEMFSPLPAVAAAPGGRVDLALPGERWQHDLALDVAVGRGRSGPAFTFTAEGEPFETGASSFVDLRLHQATRRSVGAVGALPIAVGLGPSLVVSTASLAFGRGGVFTYYGTIGLDAHVRLTLPSPGSHGLSVSASAPLAAWVARSPYALNDDRYIATTARGGLGSVFGLLGRGRVETWNRRQALQADATWTWDRPPVAPFARLDVQLERHTASVSGEALTRRHVGVAVGARFGGRR